MVDDRQTDHIEIVARILCWHLKSAVKSIYCTTIDIVAATHNCHFFYLVFDMYFLHKKIENYKYSSSICKKSKIKEE